MATASSAVGVEAIRRKVEERGPEDNYTAVLVRVLGDDAPAPVAQNQLPAQPMNESRPALATVPPARSGRSA